MPWTRSTPWTAWIPSSWRWCIRSCRTTCKRCSNNSNRPPARKTSWIWCCSRAPRRRSKRVWPCSISRPTAGFISNRTRIRPITRTNPASPSVQSAARSTRTIRTSSSTSSTCTPFRPSTSPVTCAASNSRRNNTSRYTFCRCTVSANARATRCIRCKRRYSRRSSNNRRAAKRPAVNSRSSNIRRRRDGRTRTSSDRNACLANRWSIKELTGHARSLRRTMFRGEMRRQGRPEWRCWQSVQCWPCVERQNTLRVFFRVRQLWPRNNTLVQLGVHVTRL